MTNQQNGLAVIQKKLESKDVTGRMALALGYSPDDEKAQTEARRYASSVLAEVAKSQGAEYGDLTKCEPESVCMAMVDAAQWRIMIDGRKLAHLESRYDKNRKCQVASLQIDTNGFVAKIKEQHPDFDPIITPIFKGDEYEIVGAEGQRTLKYKSKNTFGGVNDLLGIVVELSYTDHGKQIKDAQSISIADLRAIAAKGKGKAWADHPLERMKTAALKRATKWHFRKNAVLQAMVEYDNSANYDLDAPASPARKTIIDNINAASEGEAEEGEKETTTDEKKEESGGEGGVIDAEFEEVDEEGNADPEKLEALTAAGNTAAAGGWEAYKEWAGGLSEADKDVVRHLHSGWSQSAKDVTQKAWERQQREGQESANPPAQVDDHPDAPPI